MNGWTEQAGTKWIRDDRFYPEEIDPDNEFHEAVRSNFTRRYEIARDWIARVSGTRRPRVLDIACGSGYGSQLLGDLGEVVGVDVSPSAIEYARDQYGGDGVTFHVGSAEDQAFLRTLGTFDAIVSIATIEHLDDAEAFVSWMHRSLGDGGVGILGFPASLTRDWASPHHKIDISRRLALRMFSRVGFKVRDSLFQREIIRLGHLLRERGGNPEFPAPSFGHLVRHFAVHPHHLFIRLGQLLANGGFVFSHQQYLLERE